MILWAAIILLLSAPVQTAAPAYAFTGAAAACLAYGLAQERAARSPKEAAAGVLLALWLAIDAASSAIGLTWATAWGMLAVIAGGMAAWIAKTALLRAAPSDPLDAEHYFYGLRPASGFVGALNSARLLSPALYSGRVVVAGEWVYHIRGRRFARSRLKNLNLDGYAFVNTHEIINPETSARLDAIVGQPSIPFFRDCSSICSQSSLERVLIKRGIVWMRMKAGRG